MHLFTNRAVTGRLQQKRQFVELLYESINIARIPNVIR